MTDSPAPSSRTGSVRGMPRFLLQLEGAVVLAASALAYAHLGGSWLWFAVFFLAPDLTMLGYLFGARIGAAIYNAGHTYAAPAVLAALGLVVAQDVLWLGAILWIAHIGFDRMLGYGLKYASGFGDTHLGTKQHRPTAA